MTLDQKENVIVEMLLEMREHSDAIAEETRTQFKSLKAETAYLRSKIDVIAEQTLQIHDRVVGRFSEMTRSTKEAIEVAVLEVLDDPVVLAVVEADIEHQILSRERSKDMTKPKPPSRKLIDKRKRFKAAEIFRRERSDMDGGELSASCNWISAVMGEIFQKPFNALYNLSLYAIVELLCYYYIFERQSYGGMY